MRRSEAQSNTSGVSIKKQVQDSLEVAGKDAPVPLISTVNSKLLACLLYAFATTLFGDLLGCMLLANHTTTCALNSSDVTTKQPSSGPVVQHKKSISPRHLL